MTTKGRSNSILVQTLQLLAAAGPEGMTTAQLSEKLAVKSKVIANATWYQRRAERLTTDAADGTHRLTDMGRSYLDGVLFGVIKSPRNPSRQRARTVTSTVGTVARRESPVRQASPDRATQAGQHADDLIANARAAIDVHEALLDESVELTPLVRSTIDGIRRSITLIESAYQVARA